MGLKNEGKLEIITIHFYLINLKQLKHTKHLMMIWDLHLSIILKSTSLTSKLLRISNASQWILHHHHLLLVSEGIIESNAVACRHHVLLWIFR